MRCPHCSYEIDELLVEFAASQSGSLVCCPNCYELIDKEKDIEDSPYSKLLPRE